MAKRKSKKRKGSLGKKQGNKGGRSLFTPAFITALALGGTVLGLGGYLGVTRPGAAGWYVAFLGVLLVVLSCVMARR